MFWSKNHGPFTVSVVKRCERRWNLKAFALATGKTKDEELQEVVEAGYGFAGGILVEVVLFWYILSSKLR